MPFAIVVVVVANNACNKSVGETQERHANHLSEGAAATATAAGRGVSSDASSCQSDTFVVAATVAAAASGSATAGGNWKEASGRLRLHLHLSLQVTVATVACGVYQELCWITGFRVTLQIQFLVDFSGFAFLFCI